MEIPLVKLLKLLELNGRDVNHQERADILVEVIKDMYPGYYEAVMKESAQTLVKEARASWTLDDMKITIRYKMSRAAMITVSYHVYAGCSGDWHESDTYNQFTFFHQLRGYKQHF